MKTEAKSILREPRLPKWKLISLYVCICMGLFLAFLDTSIVATALFTIGSEFGALSKVNWVALAYTLTDLGCAAIFASLSDVFGRRNVYIAAFVIFLTASLGCGWAQNVEQLIALRAIQGLGASGLYSVGFVILPEISSTRMLKMIGALAGAVLAMSGVLGPLLGGIITEYTTWRWVFWINAPIGIGPLILFAIAWPTDEELAPQKRRSIRQLDFMGFLLLIGASVPLVFAFQQAGIRVVTSTNAWSAAVFVAPLVVSIVCWIMLFGWEYIIHIRWSDSISALFPGRMARSKVYLSAITSTMLMGFPYLVVIYILPIRFQIVNGGSALASGVALLPMLGSVAVGSAIAGPIATKVRNSTFFIMFSGAALMLIGTATLSALTPDPSDKSKPYGLQVLVGLGFGLTISISSMIANVENEPRDSAAAQGIMAQVRLFGGSIGIAASTVIIGTKQRRQLLDTGTLTPVQLASLHEAVTHLSEEEVLAIRKAYSDSFNQTLIVCSIIAAAALLLSAGFWEKKGSGLVDKLKQRAENRHAVGETEREDVETNNPVISEA